MKAASVHGAGDVFAKISRRVGRRAQYGPWTSLGIATLSVLVGMLSLEDIFSGSSESSSVIEVAGERLDFFEEDDEAADNCELEEDFREIITRGKNFLLPWPGLIVATLLARDRCCRKGTCIDASLLCRETVAVSPMCLSPCGLPSRRAPPTTVPLAMDALFNDACAAPGGLLGDCRGCRFPRAAVETHRCRWCCRLPVLHSSRATEIVQRCVVSRCQQPARGSPVCDEPRETDGFDPCVSSEDEASGRVVVEAGEELRLPRDWA